MNVTIPYLDSITDFGELIVLASVLSLFCTSVTEVIKNLFADILCKRNSSCMIAVSGVISMLTGIMWSESFASSDISFTDSLWLGVILWLGSQGFFIMLEDSNGFLGKYFRSLEDIALENGNSVTEEYEAEISRLIAENTALTDEISKLRDTPHNSVEIQKDSSLYFSYPVNYIAVSVPFSPSHYAVDFGWSSSYGGSDQPVYAAFSGTVDMAGFYTGGAGNMVRVFFDDAENDCRWYAIYKHLSVINVKKGNEVSLGDRLGNMGSTGDASGNHLHFDLIKVPYGAGYTQTQSNRAKYSVNPLDFLYAYPEQVVGDVTDEKYDIKRLITV